MINLAFLPLGFQAFASAGALTAHPIMAVPERILTPQQQLPHWLSRPEVAIRHPYFQRPALLAGRKIDEVEIINGDEDDEDHKEIYPITPPAPRSGEGVPLYIDDRPPPPGWRPPEKRDDSQGDGRREGGIITITPDDDPTKVDLTI